MVPAPPFFRLVDAAWRSLGVHGVVKPDCHAAGESAPGESPGIKRAMCTTLILMNRIGQIGRASASTEVSVTLAS
jgi:hypothetical protein